MDHTIDEDVDVQAKREVKQEKEETRESKESQEDSEASSKEKDKDKDKEEVQGKTQQAQEDFKNRYYYLAAEMENLKRRYEKEKESTIKYGNQQILTDLLEVLDNFDRTLDSMRTSPNCDKGLMIGVEMVHNQFYQILSRYGLTPVNTSGETFNPQFHEAMGRKVVHDKKEDEIIEVYQKGYCLNGRLIRSAKVVVAVSAQ